METQYLEALQLADSTASEHGLAMATVLELDSASWLAPLGASQMCGTIAKDNVAGSTANIIVDILHVARICRHREEEMTFTAAIGIGVQTIAIHAYLAHHFSKSGTCLAQYICRVTASVAFWAITC